MRAIWIIALLAMLLGCDSAPQATVRVEFISKTSDGRESVHNATSMSGTRTGTRVSGGVANDDDMFTATLSKIASDGVEVSITHPKYDSQTTVVAFNKQKDLNFGENAIVRIRATQESVESR